MELGTSEFLNETPLSIDAGNDVPCDAYQSDFMYTTSNLQEPKASMSHGILWRLVCFAMMCCMSDTGTCSWVNWLHCLQISQRRPWMWSREFKWTVVTSSHGSATWLPQGFWQKRPVLKYCLFNNKIFFMVHRGRLRWENQGLVVHWCTLGRQIQVQGQRV